MLGKITWEKLGRFTVESRRTSFMGVPMYEIALEESGALLPYRLRCGIKLLKEKKIRCVIAPQQFTHWDSLVKAGLQPYNPLPALQRLGGDLLLQRLQREGFPTEKATVALCGEKITAQVEEVAYQLCPRVKNLLLDFTKGAKRLEENLFQNYGLAPTPADREATASLFFTERQREKSGIALQLFSIESSIISGIHLKKQDIPPEVHPLTATALLLDYGKIPRKDIEYP